REIGVNALHFERADRDADQTVLGRDPNSLWLRIAFDEEGDRMRARANLLDDRFLLEAALAVDGQYDVADFESAALGGSARRHGDNLRPQTRADAQIADLEAPRRLRRDARRDRSPDGISRQR